MRITLLLLFAFMLAAGRASAQAGSIGVFADPAATDCNLLDVGPGIGNIYVVHVMASGGVVGVEFAAPKPACMIGATWLQDVFPYMVIGNTQTGVSVGYGACMTGTIQICAMLFFLQGTTTPCCEYRVLPAPYNQNGRIEAADCSFEPVFPTGGVARINPDASCLCNVPARPSTWGAVKALYIE